MPASQPASPSKKSGVEHLARQAGALYHRGARQADTSSPGVVGFSAIKPKQDVLQSRYLLLTHPLFSLKQLYRQYRVAVDDRGAASAFLHKPEPPTDPSANRLH